MKETFVNNTENGQGESREEKNGMTEGGETVRSKDAKQKEIKRQREEGPVCRHASNLLMVEGKPLSVKTLLQLQRQ